MDVEQKMDEDEVTKQTGLGFGCGCQVYRGWVSLFSSTE